MILDAPRRNFQRHLNPTAFRAALWTRVVLKILNFPSIPGFQNTASSNKLDVHQPASLPSYCLTVNLVLSRPRSFALVVSWPPEPTSVKCDPRR